MSVNRPNVLIISDYSAPFPGAFISSLEKLAIELNKKNLHVNFIFPKKMIYMNNLIKLGNVIFIPSFRGKKFDFILLFRVLYIVHKQNINIIHTNFGVAGKLTGNIVSRLSRSTHISHERSLILVNHKLCKKIIVKYSLKLLNFFGNNIYIAVSNEIKAQLLSYCGYTKSRIVLIPNAIHANETILDDYKILKRIKNELSEKNSIIMIAHFGPHKDHETLIKAAAIVTKKSPNILFYLIGKELDNNKSNHTRKITELISELELKENFILLGELKNPFPFIKLFDIGLLISHYEGFGNVLVEYMLSKKPVIGTNVGGIKDIIEDGVNGFLVPPRDSKILSEKITYLLENPQISKRMGEKGYLKANKDYKINVWVEQIIQLYESIT